MCSSYFNMFSHLFPIPQWVWIHILAKVPSGNLTQLLKMAIYSEFSYKKWWFPLVMLVYQRVTIGRYIYSYLQWMDSSWNMNGIIMELWDHTIPCHQTWQWTSIRNRGFNGTFIYQWFFSLPGLIAGGYWTWWKLIWLQCLHWRYLNISSKIGEHRTHRNLRHIAPNSKRFYDV